MTKLYFNCFRYYLDDSETPYYELDPGTNFWDYGNFSEFGNPDNPWAGREKMAPFDQEVHYLVYDNYRIVFKE